MNIPVPPKLLCGEAIYLLEQAFETDDLEPVVQAGEMLAGFYHLPAPRWHGRLRMKPHTLAGQCWEDGRIEIIRPRVWLKEGRPRAAWIATCLHEIGHYVLWADAERKADLFAMRIARRAKGMEPKKKGKKC